jgi:hypothetical protein
MNYANTLHHHSFAHRATWGEGLKINLKVINRVLVVSLVCSFIWYLASVNNLAVKSFVIKDLKVNVNDIVSANKDLEAQVTALSSYQYLNQKVAELKFVPAGDVKYLTANNQLLAKR